MTLKAAALFALCALPLSAHAQATGDAAAGEGDFRQCSSCHGIASPDGEVIQRLAPTGPNLWGIAGRVAGTQADYSRYSSAMKAAGEAGIMWTEENFVEYVANPTEYLRKVTGDPRARSNMNHRLRGSAENIYAYLAQFGAN